MLRRNFLIGSGLSLSALVMPGFGQEIAAEALLLPLDVSRKKSLVDIALNLATSGGASYCDVRIGRYLQQSIITRESKVQSIVSSESIGAGIRVLVKGAWGFAATSDLTATGIGNAVQQAMLIANSNAKIQTQPVQLAKAPALGVVSWATPIKINAMAIPVKEKADLLLSVNAAAMNAGANFVNSQLFLVNEQKYFASTDGSYVDQDIHRIWPNFTVTATDKVTGKFRTRNSLAAPMGMGYEYLAGTTGIQLPYGLVAYSDSINLLAEAAVAAKQAREKLSAPSVKPGKYDLVLDPTHTGLTIHETVGHPLELDRVLGYEANYAGTSFATLDKRDQKFRYGSEQVTLTADKTAPTTLGAVGYDDEGVKTKRWELIKDGVLVNYQATRDQVYLLGESESQACSYADSWSSVQFQRMANVSLAPGKKPLSVAEMIKNVDKGIYILGRGSYSIDQQRYNAQFGGQLFYEIKNGQITGMIEDVAYQIRTPEFWNACSAVCDERDFRYAGTFFDGKGQPGQVSAVSHGSSTARFDGVNVINTARTLG